MFSTHENTCRAQCLEETLQPRARCTKESFVLLQQHTHTHTEHTHKTHERFTYTRHCRTLQVEGRWGLEVRKLHPSQTVCCLAGAPLHIHLLFCVRVCALWDKNCLLCTHWFTTRSCRRCIHSNPSVQVKVMYLKDVSVTSPTGFGRSILTTNLPKLSEPDIQNLCFSFGE